MPDVAAAVAALQAAGKDVNKLMKAIESASFLDETPGEDRQKLRGMPVDRSTLYLQNAFSGNGLRLLIWVP